MRDVIVLPTYNERKNINCSKFTKIIKKSREKNFKDEGNIIIILI